MKKYVKPDLIFESHRFSHSIAGTCSVNVNAEANQSCSVKSFDPESGMSNIPGIEAMFNQDFVCSLDPTDNYCYTNGSQPLVVLLS